MALAGLFTILLVYSILIEIPFRRTYLQKGAGDILVTTGTYALTRHPGVLWLAVCLIGMFLATGTRLLIIAIPVWVIIDTLYVLIQDRYYFPRQFGKAYDDYKMTVPMLIPTLKSIRRCLKTVRNNPSK
jgi:protein-S-isoprenylcysteine O-methyltransferase Ste14